LSRLVNFSKYFSGHDRRRRLLPTHSSDKEPNTNDRRPVAPTKQNRGTPQTDHAQLRQRDRAPLDFFRSLIGGRSGVSDPLLKESPAQNSTRARGLAREEQCGDAGTLIFDWPHAESAERKKGQSTSEN